MLVLLLPLVSVDITRIIVLLHTVQHIGRYCINYLPYRKIFQIEVVDHVISVFRIVCHFLPCSIFEKTDTFQFELHVKHILYWADTTENRI